MFGKEVRTDVAMPTTTKHNERRFPLSFALATIVALLNAIPLTQAAVTEAWVHRYSNVVSNSDDRAIKVVRDAAGDIIVIGTTAGGIVSRKSPAGRRPRSRASWLAAISSSKAGFARERNRSPASVSPTLRVVRMKRAAPTRASSARTA